MYSKSKNSTKVCIFIPKSNSPKSANLKLFLFQKDVAGLKNFSFFFFFFFFNKIKI